MRLASLVLAAALIATASPAPAGEGCPVSGACVNECPLAIEVNSHRSTGEEAVFASKAARATLVKAVAAVVATL